MDKKEILKEWLRQTDQTYINDGHKIVILNAMEEYAIQQVKNCSIPDVSCFYAEKVEEAYRDGWNDRDIGEDTFHISNYS